MPEQPGWVFEHTARLPEWLTADLTRRGDIYLPTPLEQMRFALDIKKRHIDEKSGGPFVALVVRDGRLDCRVGRSRQEL